MPDAWRKLQREVVSCRRCPRLVSWREEISRVKRRAFRDDLYWGRPVPAFGRPDAQLLIVGLAPAAHGANRTGRMFSGDSSARTLIPAMYRAGFANKPVSEGPGDGLVLQNALLTAVCRCAPPGNRPTAEEMGNCRPFLAGELALLRRLRVVLALGRVAFGGYLRVLREQQRTSSRPAFRHGAVYELGLDLPVLVVSYHPSRQNTNTGRLTEDMLDEVFRQIRRLLL